MISLSIILALHGLGSAAFSLEPASPTQAEPSLPAPRPGPNPAGERVQGAGARLIGAQVQWGGPTGQEGWGGALNAQGFGLFTGRWISMRYQDRVQIGGQSGALHLRLQLQAALGAFWRLRKEQGVITRVGLELDLTRGAHLRTRWLRIPELHLGWGGILGPLQYELVALASPYLYHRAHSPQEWTSTQHSASLGGAATLVYRRIQLHLRGDWSRLHAALRPRLQADLCLHLRPRPPKSGLQDPRVASRRTWAGPYEQRYRAGLCASALASTLSGAREPLQSHSFTLSLMLGKISFLDPIR